MRALILLLLPATLFAQKTLLMVLHKAAGELAFYTPAGKLLDSVALGGHPHEMVWNGRYAYITDNGTMQIEEEGEGGNTISIVDTAARRKTGEIRLNPYRRPHGIALDARTGLLAVTCELPDQLLTIDSTHRLVLKHIDPMGKTSHMVALGSGARWAYVSNSGSNTVSAVDLPTGDLVTIPVGARPEGSAVTSDGRLLYVANRESARITVIDTSKKAAVAEIRTSRGPVRLAITPNGRTLVWACMHAHAIEAAEIATRRITGRVRLAGPPVSLSVSRDGRHAYASVQEQDAVYVVSLSGAMRVLRRISTPPGSGPDAVLEIPAR